MEDLIDKSKRLKVEAVNFYKSSNLEVILPKFGVVSFRGSFDLDLMTKRDLDIYVINPTIDRRTIINAFNEIVEEEFFYGHYFFDRKKFPKKGLPKGYYIGVNGYQCERVWKVDVWFLTEEDNPSQALTSFIKDNLTEETKEIILKLKKYRDENNLEIPGQVIYDAVLRSGIKDEMELHQYLSGSL